MNERDSVIELKRIKPSLRRTRSTAIVRNGGTQTIYGCVCGGRHTAASIYRQAKHVTEWRDKHAACAAKKLKELGELIYI